MDATIANELREHIWAMRPSAAFSLMAALEDVDLSAVQAPASAAVPTSRSGVTATIPVRGVITRRPSFMSLFFGGGGTSIEGLTAALRGAVADSEVTRIVLDIDSPGGSTDGVPELAAEIYVARATKPITALVDTTAASAAYWLASQASEIIVTPSGSVGSIGVFGIHMDLSRMLEQAGITPTFIRAGKYKAEENPLEPLTDEAKAAVQERIDAFYGMFVRDVARGRGVAASVVRSDFGEGRMVLAKDAVSKGMADKVTGRAPAEGGARAETPDQAIWAVSHANAARIQRSIAVAH